MSVPSTAITKGGIARTPDGAVYVEFATGGSVVLAQSGVAVSGAADTNENALATITIPANSLGINGSIRVWHLWTVTNSANNKTMRVRFSGASGTIYNQIVLTTSAINHQLTVITNRGATNSQVGSASLSSSFGASASANVTSAVDTTADTTIVITGQKASAGETITLERYMVEIVPGA
jgi:hypothetical protein